MKEDANEKRLELIKSVLALSDEDVLKVILNFKPEDTTESHEGGNPHDPPPGDPPGGGK